MLRRALVHFFAGICFAAVFALLTVAHVATPAFAQTSNDASSSGFENQIKPNLEIRIPDLEFSDITVTSSTSAGEKTGKIDVPYLSQYIGTLYKFAVAISGILAIVMMMVGGFQYMIARDTGLTKKGRETIVNALVGLGLTLFAFIILNTINPDLVKLDAISVETVPPSEFELIVSDLANTQVDTQELDPTAEFGSVQSSGTTVGSHTPEFTSCPILNLPAAGKGDPSTEPRAVALYEEIGKYLTATSPADRIVQVSDIAAKCGVSFGSCGRAAATIYALAGVKEGTYAKFGQCNLFGKKIGPDGKVATGKGAMTGCIANHTDQKLQFGLTDTQRQTVTASLCNSGGVDECVGYCKVKNDECRKNCEKQLVQTGCVDTKKEAIKKAANYLYSQSDLQKTGWPDRWADSLLPGDALYIYNANSSGWGAHSIIFLGWKDNQRIQVAQGAAGKLVNIGSICVRSSCGDDMKPIMYIWRP